MPASYEPEGERAGRRRLAWLFWAGVGVAPLAALLLLMGQGVGALRAAAVLAVLSVVMIGLSVTLREDVTTVRDDFSETLRREVDLVRADVDTLRRGVELTMHRELERVRGELEAARHDTVLRAEATRLQAVEGRYERISGEVPSPEDFQTIEPIREEFAQRENARVQQPMMTEQIRVDTIRADAAVRSEPVRVAAARVDANSGTTYSSAARSESSGYERYESYEPYDAYDEQQSAPTSGPGTELEPVSAARWTGPAWDSGEDDAPHTAEWQPPAWDGAEEQANTYASAPATDGYASQEPASSNGSYGFGRDTSTGTTYGSSTSTSYPGTSYPSANDGGYSSDGSADVISGDVLTSDTNYDYGNSAGWSSPTTYSLGSEALSGGGFGSGNGFGLGNGFGSTSFGNDGLSTYVSSSSVRSSLPELPALPSATSVESDSWSQPPVEQTRWETPAWDDTASSSYGSWSTPEPQAWPAETYSAPSVRADAPSSSDSSYSPPPQQFVPPASPQYPSEFELPSLDHLPTVNVRASIGGFSSGGGFGGGNGRHSSGENNGSGAGDYGHGYESDLPAERRIFLDLPEQSYNWRG